MWDLAYIFRKHEETKVQRWLRRTFWEKFMLVRRNLVSAASEQQVVDDVFEVFWAGADRCDSLIIFGILFYLLSWKYQRVRFKVYIWIPTTDIGFKYQKQLAWISVAFEIGELVLFKLLFNMVSPEFWNHYLLWILLETFGTFF